MSSTAIVKKKRSKLKSLRGFVTGKSRREKRKEKANKLKAEGKVPDQTLSPDDDMETVYGAQFDDRSVASSVASSVGNGSPLQRKSPASPLASLMGDETTATDSIQVVLLLMDPGTRRFELLQLEFDSSKALVSDVLLQVPLSATEPVLQNQVYVGVCNRFGTEMIQRLRLAEFCASNEVVLAIPEGLSPKDCAKLARPILGDPKVVAMLHPSEPENMPALNEDEIVDSPSPSPMKRSLDYSEEAEAPAEKKAESAGMSLSGLLFTDYVTTPLAPGQALSPGHFRSKCGFGSFLPEVLSKCNTSSTLVMGRDGVLRMYDGRSVAWEMAGTICKDDCVPGAVLGEDGYITIGGKQVYVVTGDVPNSLAPWPFMTDPKIIKKKRQS
eukprot:scaffold148694_cov60-Attheya_sp.AAC.1